MLKTQKAHIPYWPISPHQSNQYRGLTIWLLIFLRILFITIIINPLWQLARFQTVIHSYKLYFWDLYRQSAQPPNCCGQQLFLDFSFSKVPLQGDHQVHEKYLFLPKRIESSHFVEFVSKFKNERNEPEVFQLMFFIRHFTRFLELTKAQFLQHTPVIPATNPTQTHALQQRFSRILRRVQLDPLRLITVHRLSIRQPPHNPLTILLLHPPI